MPLEFAGAAVILRDEDIAAAAARLGIEPAVVRSVDEVESRGHGFLPDGRPTILFERHVFSRRTGHRYDASHPGISHQIPGGYGAPGAHQYDRLHEAIEAQPLAGQPAANDRKAIRQAALQSASWGRYQVMGFNAEICGWPDVEAFVASMQESEAEHLKAFIGYCRANDLVRFLATHDWRSFAAGYNGKGNIDDYSQKLAIAYRRHAAATSGVSHPIRTDDPAGRTAGTIAITPDQKLRAIQLVLGVKQDGDFGRISRAAFNELLQAAGQAGI